MTGLSIGSHTLDFNPQLRPSALMNRNINIAAESAAASTMRTSNPSRDALF